jgi:hypothetical protein
MQRRVSHRFSLAGLLLLALTPAIQAQRDFDGARQLIGRTDHDLRAVSPDALSEKERERYDNALRDLSEFDKDLSHGKYDKGKLNDAIDDVNNVCKNNTLPPEQRDVLQSDLEGLRALRDRW